MQGLSIKHVLYCLHDTGINEEDIPNEITLIALVLLHQTRHAEQVIIFNWVERTDPLPGTFRSICNSHNSCNYKYRGGRQNREIVLWSYDTFGISFGINHMYTI